MKYKDCIEKALLKKARVSNEEIENQIKIAENYARKAEIVFGKDTYDVSFLTAYISIFHSARALLFVSGYKERSHFCLFEFLIAKFKDNSEIIRLAQISQNYRETRHLIQYEGELSSDSAAKEIISDAKTFVKLAKKYVRKV